MAGSNRRSSHLLLLFVLLLIALSSVAEFCRPKCRRRCSATSHKSACMWFCLMCCSKCKCVPPGTYGKKNACPCYSNMKTKEGKPKCP
uniref:Uncharacterized protein n=1 Tax=Nelumbo nucifera TaxID=4432 RepID=A0A822YDA8_NELNU|nr:TPA_asm: hypothetical protein HUJ06_010975 [Nelumbo nucifera]